MAWRLKLGQMDGSYVQRRVAMNSNIPMIPDRLQDISIEQALSLYLLDCQTRNLSPRTVPWYEAKIRGFFEFLRTAYAVTSCPVSVLTEEPIRRYIQHCKEREHLRVKGRCLSSATVKGAVMALKAFLTFLYKEGYLKDNLGSRIGTPRLENKMVKALSPEQIKSLLAMPDKKSFVGFRNYCMLLTFLDTGVRLSELIGMTVGGMDFSSNTFVVLGKGNKERRVPFGIGLRKALEKYVMWRGEIPEEDTFFVDQFGERMKQRHIQEIVARYGKKAGIADVRISPHMLRHTFAKLSLLNGLDAITLQYILGHNSLDMVRYYVNLTQKDMALQKNRFSVVDRLGVSREYRKKLWK